MANKIYAIVPARSGSTGLPHKNIKLLGGKPLIAHTIEFAKNLKSVDRIFCSTDSEDYAAVARQFGAEVPFLRPKKYADDSSVDRDFFLHAINWFKENEKKNT